MSALAIRFGHTTLGDHGDLGETGDGSKHTIIHGVSILGTQIHGHSIRTDSILLALDLMIHSMVQDSETAGVHQMAISLRRVDQETHLTTTMVRAAIHQAIQATLV